MSAQRRVDPDSAGYSVHQIADMHAPIQEQLLEAMGYASDIAEKTEGVGDLALSLVHALNYLRCLGDHCRRAADSLPPLGAAEQSTGAVQ